VCLGLFEISPMPLIRPIINSNHKNIFPTFGAKIRHHRNRATESTVNVQQMTKTV